MTARIDSIYFFDYTSTIGHYVSLQNFASVEMRYLWSAISSPGIHVDFTPISYSIPSESSSRIREYAISQMPYLPEISKDLAINSPKYIMIRYCDATERYFGSCDAFSIVFEMASRYKPSIIEEDDTISPYAILKNDDWMLPSYSTPAYTPARPVAPPMQYTYPPQTNPAYYQQHSSLHPATAKKKTTWPKFILIVIVVCIFLVPIIGYVVKEAPAPASTTAPTLAPATEPRSGAILSGREASDGAELTITAASGSSCVVKLKTATGVERLSFYVRAGETVTMHVPREYLYVYFASGKTWYGNVSLFGDGTSYSMDDELINFKTYSWEYTLYPVTNGNFSQTPIDPEDF